MYDIKSGISGGFNKILGQMASLYGLTQSSALIFIARYFEVNLEYGTFATYERIGNTWPNRQRFIFNYNILLVLEREI